MQIISLQPEITINLTSQQTVNQLENKYYLPRIPEDYTDVWTTRLLDSVETQTDHTDLFARFRLTKEYLDVIIFIRSQSGQKDILKIKTKDEYPVFGSMIEESKVISVIFQKFNQNKFSYSAYLFYPQQQEEEINIYLQNQKQYLKLYDSVSQKLEVYLLGSQQQKQQEIKNGGKILYSKTNHHLRILCLVQNQSVLEYHVEYDELILQTISDIDNVDQIQYINKKYDRKLCSLSDFCIFSTNSKIVIDHIENTTNQSNLCYLQFNKESKELIQVQKINSDQGCAFKVIVGYQVEISAKKPCIKQILTFLTPSLPLTNYQINSNSNELIEAKTCKIQYIALSANNSVICFSYPVQKKLQLHVFHVQTGSHTKISSDSLLGYLNTSQMNQKQVQQQQLDATQFASRICKYLIAGNKITSNQLAEYYSYYHALYWRQIITKQQPKLYVQSYSLLWAVPSANQLEMEVYLIKCLPLIPTEMILCQKIKLQQTDNYIRLLDFINQDKEFYQAGSKHSSRLQDYQFYTKLDPKNFFALSQEDLSTTITIESSQCVALCTDDVMEEYKQLNSAQTSTNISSFEDLSSNASPGLSRTTSFVKTFKGNRIQQLVLFSDDITIPIFTNHEVSLCLNTRQHIKNPSFFTSNNLLFWQMPIKQIYKQTNNILVSIDFHKSINKVLTSYDNSALTNIYDISQYAINQVLFTSQIYDELSQSFCSLSVHPIKILQSVKKQVEEISSGQNKLASYYRYISDLIQQIVKLYQVQSGEFLSILKALLGQDICKYIDEHLNDVNNLAYHLINYLTFETLQYIPEISSILYISLCKLSLVIQKTFQLVDVRTSSILPHCYEYIIADYIMYQSIFNKLDQSTKQSIVKLVPYPVYTDYSKDHPLAKMYSFTLYLQQQILGNFLESDQLFLKCLRLKNQVDVHSVTTSWEQLQYYRIFDKSLKQIIRILNGVQNKEKECVQQLTDASSGVDVIFRISNALCKIKYIAQQFISQESSYLQLLQQNQLHALTVASEIIQCIQLDDSIADNVYGNQNSPQLFMGLPQWLLNKSLAEFDNLQISNQLPYSFQDYGDLNSVSSIINENQAILTCKTGKKKIFEAELLQNVYVPYQLKREKAPCLDLKELKVKCQDVKASDPLLIQSLKWDIDVVLTVLQKEEITTKFNSLQLVYKLESVLRITNADVCQQLIDYYQKQKHEVKQLALQQTMTHAEMKPYLSCKQIAGKQLQQVKIDSQQKLTAVQLQTQLSQRTLQKYAEQLDLINIFSACINLPENMHYFGCSSAFELITMLMK
ncbi:Conserved_hypothetical protein [Hexamita inflata]|uniref:Uncharacterized protein n=1 Tax=Hexamita inflata TaxID=28002 RepID=A0AA86TTF2_9EUKA|nr:Conserved hypothetical protein [Hexamita inflata]